MKRHFLTFSSLFIFIAFYPGYSFTAGDLPLLIKSTPTITGSTNVFEIAIATKTETNIFKPFAVTVEDSRAMTKFVTPNGDGKNDTFVFQCYNPMDLAVRGKIYSLKSRLVAEMQDADVSPSDNYSELAWNPNSGYENAKGGVYIYQILIGVKVYKGTVIVIR
ncbi:MAG: gliding motility-associated C-terminal domain-containing protein [Elusimicrobia bacterium]|nr:gliding motility-associated C-terminal domain-containing protein [Elusimicrobiota bacterium]